MAETIPSFHSILLEFFEVCLQIHQLESQTDKQIQELIASRELTSAHIDEINLAFEKDFQRTKDKGGFLLHQLFFLSERENFYFFDCPLQVYKDHYKSRKKVFLKENLDAKEKDFIACELKNLKHPGCKRILEFPVKTMCKACSAKKAELHANKLCKQIGKGSGLMFLNNQTVLVNYSRLIPTVAPWKYSTGRKIAFLEKKLIKLKNKKKADLIPDTAQENKLTANQSVLLLDQLGVFALPFFEKTSKNKQAEILCKLIGKHSKNIKTAMERLDRSPSSLGAGYQRDMSIIQQFLNELE